jgi:hypothetical protein
MKISLPAINIFVKYVEVDFHAIADDVVAANVITKK